MKSTPKCMLWRAFFCLGIHFWMARSVSCDCSETGITRDTQLNITCDSYLDVYVDGTFIGAEEYPAVLKYVIREGSEVIAVKCRGIPSYSTNAILASLGNGLITDHTWKCTQKLEPGWNMKTFDDLDWPSATERDTNNHTSPVLPWGQKMNIADGAKYIWTQDINNAEIYCRRLLIARCSERRFGFYTTKNEWTDKALKNSILKKTTVKSVLDCGMSCLNTPGCLSFNTEHDTTKEERLCELSNQKDAASMSYRKEFQYYEIIKAGY